MPGSSVPADAQAFFAAVKARDHQAVRACLEADPALASATDEGSFDAPAVILAAGRGDRDMIDLLLSFGADIDQKSGWWAGGFTALNSGHPRDLHRDGLADFLIDRGATVDAHSAAGLGRLERLRELVAAAPAVVHEPGGDKLRPLHYAASPEIAAFLLDHGAEVDARDVDHHGTAAQWNVLVRPEVARFLVGRGAAADLFLHVPLGDAAAVRAAVDADPAALEALSEHGSAPGGHVHEYTVAGRTGATPLMVASRWGGPEMVDLLLTLGARVEAAPRGVTALHYAAWGGRVENARRLVEAGAPLSPKDEEHGGSPLGWAGHFGHREVAEYLTGAGAE